MRHAELKTLLVSLSFVFSCGDVHTTPEPVEAEKRAALTASGETEESAELIPAETESRGNVGLEPELWDPNAFTRPRRRMTVRQLDLAIRDATGGIGWDEAGGDYESRFFELASTLGVPDYLQRVKVDLTPGMTFQKFLSDGANVICSKLINYEQQIPAEERVFLVHIDPDTNPLDAPLQTDANIKMLLLRFHAKSIALADPAMEPWRNLVNNIAGNVGPAWGEWLQAWDALCIALIRHPDFYSY